MISEIKKQIKKKDIFKISFEINSTFYTPNKETFANSKNYKGVVDNW